MKEKLIDEIKTAMRTVITADQMSILCNVLNRTLQNIVIAEKLPDSEARIKANSQLQTLFISAKRVEGCSEKTLKYYASTIEYMLRQIDKNIVDITTTDLRCYLASYQSNNQSSKVTIDNIRRIFSSFFAWLEDEDYILKSPVRRIHKVKTGSLIKEVLSDENLEILRDNCTHIRDLAIVDMLSSTGIRVGELVKINREDIDFHERECIVFGKGNKEREVYFNARTKIHLKQYLESRTDDNPALFVSIAKPHNRLKISGVELRLRQLGRKVSIHKVHPHKFRRTLPHFFPHIPIIYYNWQSANRLSPTLQRTYSSHNLWYNYMFPTDKHLSYSPKNHTVALKSLRHLPIIHLHKAHYCSIPHKFHSEQCETLIPY